MRKLIYIFFILSLSCSKLDIEIDEKATYINENLKQQFSTVDIISATKRPHIDSIEVIGVVDGDCATDIGYFYSHTNELLYDSDLTYQQLQTAGKDIIQVAIDLENLTLQDGKDTFRHVKQLPVDTTYFFRTYAIYQECPNDISNLKRYVLSPPEKQLKETLKSGWYKRRKTGLFWARYGAYAIENKDRTKCIIGGGCVNISHCNSSIDPYPTLHIREENGAAIIEAFETCPIFNGNKIPTIQNRGDGVAFWIRDSIYFGTGFMSNNVLNDFYVYGANSCPTEAYKMTLPNTFKARTGAVGFTIDNYGYIGLGREALPFTSLDNDFWLFNPNNSTDQQWKQLELTSKDNLFDFPRAGATVFTINDKAAIIGGGRYFGAPNNTIWLFEPDPENLVAKVTNLGTLKEQNGIRDQQLENGIGFTINDRIFIGLGNLNNNFYERINDQWEIKYIFPGASIDNPVSFVLGNRGYMFTGFSNDSNGNNPPSRDLWIFIP